VFDKQIILLLSSNSITQKDALSPPKKLTCVDDLSLFHTLGSHVYSSVLDTTRDRHVASVDH